MDIWTNSFNSRHNILCWCCLSTCSSSMDEDALNMRNWGYYEPSFKGHLGLHLMAERDKKPFIPGRDPNNLMVTTNAFHPRDCIVSEAPPIRMQYVRDTWISQREKLFNMLPPVTAPNYDILPETSATHSMPIWQPPPPPDASTRDERVIGRVEEPAASKEGVQSKKRQVGGDPKTPKAKKPRKPKDNTNSSVKPAKKGMDITINGYDMDISSISIPVCSCTGTAQQCYRWGCGGWQSACCTTNVSMYPLPMSTKRRGARIAGRKMSQGAFKKVLEKLAAENYDFSNPIDLRTHWARHGTNKFVIIR